MASQNISDLDRFRRFKKKLFSVYVHPLCPVLIKSYKKAKGIPDTHTYMLHKYSACSLSNMFNL